MPAVSVTTNRSRRFKRPDVIVTTNRAEELMLPQTYHSINPFLGGRNRVLNQNKIWLLGEMQRQIDYEMTYHDSDNESIA
jgi:hypothetical protein